jgi:putative transcriptional regulator
MNRAPMHHPAEDTLLRHAAGTLPPGRSLVVAVHLPFCAACQAAVRLGEAIGGAMLADLPPAELAPDALSRTLARLDSPTRQRDAAAEPILLGEGVPLPDVLRGLVRPKWRWVAPGISRITVDVPRRNPETAGAREHAWLLRVTPGASLPDHGHRGWEATCVLAGSFSDVTGTYAAGDVAEPDVGVMHQPVAGAGEPCVCLIAWEGRLRMRGMLARLVQPLLGV